MFFWNTLRNIVFALLWFVKTPSKFEKNYKILDSIIAQNRYRGYLLYSISEPIFEHFTYHLPDHELSAEEITKLIRFVKYLERKEKDWTVTSFYSHRNEYKFVLYSLKMKKLLLSIYLILNGVDLKNSEIPALRDDEVSIDYDEFPEIVILHQLMNLKPPLSVNPYHPPLRNLNDFFRKLYYSSLTVSRQSYEEIASPAGKSLFFEGPQTTLLDLADIFLEIFHIYKNMVTENHRNRNSSLLFDEETNHPFSYLMKKF